MMTATAPVSSSGARDAMSRQLDYENQFVSFVVDGQLLGVPVGAVQEVLNPQVIAATPLARPEIAGLLNLRGQIVTAVNLRRRLGLPDRSTGEKSMNVVVHSGGESFSLLVDEVGDVINVSGVRLEPPPRTIDIRWRAMVVGVFRLEARLLVILDVNAVLTLP
jgi:purine-binding chemotaxis protein CheW